MREVVVLHVVCLNHTWHGLLMWVPNSIWDPIKLELAQWRKLGKHVRKGVERTEDV